MARKWKVGIVGATGMVGQRFLTLLEHHPWFTPALLAASARSAGKPYEEAVGKKWALSSPIPAFAKNMTVRDAADFNAMKEADFIFCAVNLGKEETKLLEESYARAGIPVVSNNSAHPW